MLRGSFPSSCAILVLYVVAQRVSSAASTATLVMSSNSPTVRGSKCGFSAKLEDPDHSPGDDYTFTWTDNYSRIHRQVVATQELSSSIVFAYEAPGNFRASLKVTKKRLSIIDWPVASGTVDFSVTEYLNGRLTPFQNGDELPTDASGTYLGSSRHPTTFKVELHDPYNYVGEAGVVSLLWTVDDEVVNSTSDYNVTLNLTNVRLTKVHVTVAAFFNQPTTTTPATTTTTTTTAPITAPAMNTTTKPTTGNTTTVVPSTPTTPSSLTRGVTETQAKRDLNSSGLLHSIESLFRAADKEEPKGASPVLSAAERPGPGPFVMYGDFETTIDVSDPIDNVTVVGDNWLRRGSLLRLNVTCSGSGPWRWCWRAHDGAYNVTGAETCPDGDEMTLYVCETRLVHYFPQPGVYTAVIVLRNSVGRKVKGVAVNVYDVASEPQLSTIIVPVVGCVLAVVFVIFGLAYYFQNRSRFLVETADFDFQAGPSDGGGDDDSVLRHGFWERVRDEFRALWGKPSDEDMIRPSTVRRGRGGLEPATSASIDYGGRLISASDRSSLLEDVVAGIA